MGDSMSVSAAMAKLAGLARGISAALEEDVSRRGNGKDKQFRQTFSPEDFGHYFQRTGSQITVLRKELPDLYGDLQQTPLEPETGMMDGTKHFSRGQMERLLRDINEVFEIRASSEHAAPAVKTAPRRVFISHGRAKDWYEVQAHIERDLKIGTLELAQETGMVTIIEKLEEKAQQCDAAVFVMSGDDVDSEGQLRSRENVLHEIGYFQAKYGRRNVILLHEDGVSIPSNLAGIVYVAYPKATPAATFGTLDRELKAIYGIA